MGSSKLKGESLKRKGFALSAVCSMVIVCLGSCLLIPGSVRAQTFAEWFSQGKTQVKYLAQQIAALNALRVTGEQGYSMLKNEWGAIGSFKNGEFGLHRVYYSSLSSVSPVVKGSVDVTALQAQQQTMVALFAALVKLPGLGSGDLVYIAEVRDKVMADYADGLSELQKVMQAGVLVMSDDERIKRVKVLTADLQDAYAFACSFSASVRVLSVQRSGELNEVQTLYRVYGKNN